MISAEQQRKKSLAMQEAQRHHIYANVAEMGVERADMKAHNARFNPYNDWEAEERKENGRPIHDYKFNEGNYRR